VFRPVLDGHAELSEEPLDLAFKVGNRKRDVVDA
jgi:hypothetical protein